jgi:branched-subunit amino acid aminotransferase/4-amino-4-deoxychorismate lyase
MTTPTITCINGRFSQAHRAAVGVADRGFRFGDGVFETIRLSGGVPYQWALHMQRMTQGLEAIGITMPNDDLQAMARKTIARNEANEGFLRIAISRGEGSKGYLPFPAGMPATYAIEYLPALPTPEKPYCLWLSSWAKIPAQCLPTRFKLAQGLNSILAMREAQENGCEDALQLTTDGLLSEAGSANLFWIKDGTLFTPSLDTNCLSGTTRDAVLRLSPAPVRHVSMGLSELEKADAVFISNTRLGVHPISAIEPMGWQFAINHPLLRQLSGALKDDYARERRQHAAAWKTP